MQNTIFKPISIILLVFGVLTSCKSTKNIAERSSITKLPVKKIIQEHYANQINFKTLAGKISIDYEQGDSSQGFGVSLRMKKDEVIWMSATLGVVKAKITPEKVEFYNRLDNEYFEGDYQYLSNLLGQEFDFDKLQNLLLGNAVLDLKEKKYVSEIQNDKYLLKLKSAEKLYKLLFGIDPIILELPHKKYHNLKKIDGYV